MNLSFRKISVSRVYEKVEKGCPSSLYFNVWFVRYIPTLPTYTTRIQRIYPLADCHVVVVCFPSNEHREKMEENADVF